MTGQPDLTAGTRRSPIRNSRLDPDYWRAGPDPPQQSGPTQPVPVPPPPSRRGRAVLVEVVLAGLVSCAVAVGMGWRVVTRLGWVVPGAGSEPFAGLWSLAWSGHALRPGSGVGLSQLFDGNAFHPADYSLAFGDPLLGFGPLTWAFSGPEGLLTAYNVLFVAAPALAALGGYALARQLGGHPVGAAVAGAALGYAPWHAGQFGSLGVISTGPLLVGLAMLARGHGLRFAGAAFSARELPQARPPLRPLWVLLGWLACAFQLSLAVGSAVTMTYLLAVIAAVTLLIAPVRALAARRAGLPRRPRAGLLVAADLLGAAGFALVAAVLAYPVLRVQSIDPAAFRLAGGLDQVAARSPRPRGLLSAPAIEGTWSWLPFGVPGAGADAVRLLPGAVLLGLALLGIGLSTWRWWWRVALAALALALLALSVGTRFPAGWLPGQDTPYTLAWRYLPGWRADPRPGLLVVPATLALALLAAGAVGRICGWAARGRRGPRLRLRAAVAAILPVLVLAEGWVVIPLARAPEVPRAVAEAAAPLVVLPSGPAGDAEIMYWSALRGLPALANGQARLTPTTLGYLRDQLSGFPDARSVAFLRSNGFHAVAVLRALPGQAAVPAAEAIPDPALNLTRVDYGDSVLFSLQ